MLLMPGPFCPAEAEALRTTRRGLPDSSPYKHVYCPAEAEALRTTAAVGL